MLIAMEFSLPYTLGVSPPEHFGVVPPEHFGVFPRMPHVKFWSFLYFLYVTIQLITAMEFSLPYILGVFPLEHFGVFPPACHTSNTQC